MARSIRGETALITGAARRLGREMALSLAGEGANIVVHYNRSEQDAQELCRELSARGVKAWSLGAELGNPEQAESLMDRACALAGRIDILVNNASIFPTDRLENLELSSVMSNLAVNAWAPFALSRAFRHQTQRGAIVNMLDSRVWGYDWSHVGYILSKQVLTTLTRMTALDFAPGITVNAVAPGLILPPPSKDESYLKKLQDTVPLKRYGQPSDIADAVRFLVTSTFLTGTILFVDGGRHLWEYTRGPHPD